MVQAMLCGKEEFFSLTRSRWSLEHTASGTEAGHGEIFFGLIR